MSEKLPPGSGDIHLAVAIREGPIARPFRLRLGSWARPSGLQLFAAVATSAGQVEKTGGDIGSNAAHREACVRSMAIHLLSRLLPSIGRGIALACLIVLPLAGCIKSKGPLLPAERASTPLPAGSYHTISNLKSGADFPTLKGPSRFLVRGNTYTVTPDHEKPLRFHLIRLADTSNVYILQTDKDDKQGYRDVLIGVVGKDGFCSKDIRNFPSEAVTDNEIVSKEILLRWLVDNATEIPLMANDVCFIRKS